MTEPQLLLQDLIDLRNMFRNIITIGLPEWQQAAVSSSCTVMEKYVTDLQSAITSQAVSDQQRIACVVSGIRKGILELGFIDSKEDKVLIELIDRVSSRALTICHSNIV